MKKYLEIYNYYKDLITTKQIKSGDKMPSIRSASNLFGVSKTTIQNAYFDLQADGYILSSPKSGFYVSDIKAYDFDAVNKEENTQSIIKYDLKSGDADINAFDINLWQRYIKSALRQRERLLSYSEVQGETDLREALVDYIREKRNVVTSADRIIVGAGVQSLLGILCTLIKDRDTVSFPDESFNQGINLFKNYGFDVHTRYKDAKIIYVSPSHMTSYGDVMPVKRRIELIHYSRARGSIIIEDDFDSDFLYNSKPMPSLYALSGINNVVYMGSFSNVLIPGIRISFMVLTKELAIEFKKQKDNFSQTASKTEQIALCQYIRDGHIKSQTRKIRRHYINKSKIMYDLLVKALPCANISISENGLQIKLECDFFADTDVFAYNGFSVYIKSYENNRINLIISPSSIKESEIEKCVNELIGILQSQNKD